MTYKKYIIVDITGIREMKLKMFEYPTTRTDPDPSWRHYHAFYLIYQSVMKVVFFCTLKSYFPTLKIE